MLRWTVTLGLLLLGACGGGTDGGEAPAERPLLVRDGAVAVAVVVPATAGTGLRDAAADLLEAFARIGGATAAIPAPVAEADGPRVRVEIAADDALGEQGYRLLADDDGLTVRAATEIGAMYGLYRVAADVGAVYLEPEESFFPSRPDARLPGGHDGAADVPHFATRGFHEHTQHPIPASDFLLRPGDEARRKWAKNYVRWLARNRQNMAFFHMLGTVDLDAWVPYMREITEDAHARGVRVGAVIGFVDQQQHAFRLIREDAPESAEAQIAAGLDRVLAAGLDAIGLQIGTSEFTKPADADALGWMRAAIAHLRARWPDVTPYGWIHTTCSLEDERGGKYYHLPLQVEGLGAFVHTTMFYTLRHPAPVYDCEDFSHQEDFLERSGDDRELVFFPETAWWLGFDNNVPLVLPITGWSRQFDVQQALRDYPVSGHVTFTSGREWTYWQYDHYLTRLTWDGDLTWDAYLESLAPLYGGPEVATALKGWTALQVRHFYEENPLIYFYLAGELPQDELGEQAGVLARRPKIAFRQLLEWDDATFDAWKARDFAMLERMRGEYAALRDALPAAGTGTEQQKRLYAEARDALHVSARRVDHAVALYGGAAAARAWRASRSSEDEARARAALDLARAITAEVTALFVAAEDRYRYPREILTLPKPESPTAYRFGYLAETSTGFFWSRRDDQLAALLDEVFSADDDVWSADPRAVYAAEKAAMTVVEPAGPLAARVMQGFVPRLLVAFVDGDATLDLRLAADHQSDGQPDAGSEIAVAAARDGEGWRGTAAGWPLAIRDGAGTVLGRLTVRDPALTVAGAGPEALATGELAGGIGSADLVGFITSIAGIDADGAANLVKAAYGFDRAAPLPDVLPLRVAFDLTALP